MLNPDCTERERERVREDRYRSAVKQMGMQRGWEVEVEVERNA